MRTIVGLMLLTFGVAQAEETEARRHFDRGLKAYNLQRFDVALEEFRAAYLEAPQPAFLFNVGQAQRNLGQYDAAAKSYRAYLNSVEPNAPVRDQIERLITVMDLAAQEGRAKLPPTGPLATPAIVRAHPDKPAPARPPLYRRAWLWATVGAVVAAGAAVGIGVGVARYQATPSADTPLGTVRF